MEINESLSTQIVKLSNKIIELKKFSFTHDELDFNHKKLIEKKIITVQTNKIQIEHYEVIAQKTLPYFQNLYSYEFSNDPLTFKQFQKEIENYFEEGFLNGRTAFYSAIFSWSLKLFINKYNGSLKDLVDIYYREDGSIYQFQRGLNEAFEDLIITSQELIDFINDLYDKVRTDQAGVIDMNVISLASGLKSYLNKHSHITKDLLELCILPEQQLLKPFHPTIIAANYEHDHAFLIKINELAQVPVHQAAVVCALSSVTCTSTTPFAEFIQLVEKIETPTQDCVLELPRFYTNMLRHMKAADKAVLVHKCFKALNSFIHRYPDKWHLIISEVRFLENYEQEITDLAITILTESDTFENSDILIFNVFTNFSNSSYFFIALRKVILKGVDKFRSENYRSIVSLLQSKDPVGFDRHLIQMLIDDKGEIRFAARRLLHSLSTLSNKRIFKMDILDLSAIEQYKLCISITDDFHEPKYIVPFVSPLLSSQYELVRDLTVHRFEIMCENYLSDVTDALKDCIDLENSQNAVYYNRIEAFMSKYNDRLNKKWDTKELDPRYTQYKYFKQFYQLNSRSMQESMDKSVNEKSLMSLFGTNVMLAKGGGYMLSQKEGIFQLSTIRTKMTLPREYFISPEKYDWLHRHQIFEDWKGIFEPWEAMISS